MAELRCDQVVELVTDYLEGALDEADHRDIVEHLSGCNGCGAYVEQFRQTVRTLGELPADQQALTPQTRARLLAAFRARKV